MNEILLPGLTARHAGHFLAACGFYEVFNDAQIGFRLVDGEEVVVLRTAQAADAKAVTGVLCDRRTWERLGVPPNGCDLNQTQLHYSAFQAVKELSPRIAYAFGTDQKVSLRASKDDDGGEPVPVAVKSPFWLFSRQAKYETEIWKLIEAVTSEPERVFRTLTDLMYEDRYQEKAGINFGLFYEEQSGDLWKNVSKGDNKKPRNIPVICLLATLGWRAFPCFLDGFGNGVAPGWKIQRRGREVVKTFVYPVLGTPVSRDVFCSWALNPYLRSFGDFRKDFRKSGVLAVYESEVLDDGYGGGTLLASHNL